MVLRFVRPPAWSHGPGRGDPLNVLVMANHLETGGAEQFVVRLANELDSRGHQVVVMSAGGELAALLSPRVAHAFAPSRNKSPWNVSAVAATVARLMSAHAIDIVHANSTNTACSAWLAREASAPPIVASAHGVWPNWKKPGVARAFGAFADRVVGCSEELTRDLLGHGLRVDKAFTIHNGIPLPPRSEFDALGRAAVRHELGIAPERPLILAVGRLVEQKGFATLLTAMQRVLASQPAAALAIAGTGELREALEAQAEALGVAQAVRFLGRRNDVTRLLAAADVFCLPSLDEGLPLAMAEAMAAGLPVVATPVGGVPELVVHGETGWLVPPRMPAALALRLIGLLADPVMARAMGQAGRERVVEGFSLERMATRFETLYREMLRIERRKRLTA